MNSPPNYTLPRRLFMRQNRWDFWVAPLVNLIIVVAAIIIQVVSRLLRNFKNFWRPSHRSEYNRRDINIEVNQRTPPTISQKNKSSLPTAVPATTTKFLFNFIMGKKTPFLLMKPSPSTDSSKKSVVTAEKSTSKPAECSLSDNEIVVKYSNQYRILLQRAYQLVKGAQWRQDAYPREFKTLGRMLAEHIMDERKITSHAALIIINNLPKLKGNIDSLVLSHIKKMDREIRLFQQHRLPTPHIPELENITKQLIELRELLEPKILHEVKDESIVHAERLAYERQMHAKNAEKGVLQDQLAYVQTQSERLEYIERMTLDVRRRLTFIETCPALYPASKANRIS